MCHVHNAIISDMGHCLPLGSLHVPVGGWGGILQSKQSWKGHWAAYFCPIFILRMVLGQEATSFLSVNRLGPSPPSFRPPAESLRLGVS